jgi:hypothetical protein
VRLPPLSATYSSDSAVYLVESDYTVVFFAAGSKYTPGWNWMWKAYRSLSRKYRKNLKRLVCVLPDSWARTLTGIPITSISCTLISSLRVSVYLVMARLFSEYKKVLFSVAGAFIRFVSVCDVRTLGIILLLARNSFARLRILVL